jgi:protein-tyrosine phosphatase
MNKILEKKQLSADVYQIVVEAPLIASVLTNTDYMSPLFLIHCIIKEKIIMKVVCIAVLYSIIILGGCGHNSAVVPEIPRPASGSLLPIEGVYNIRDMGGYRTGDGKTVRWDLVIRAGELNKMSPGGVTYLEELGIKTVVDFRVAAEKDAAPSVPIGSVQRTYYFPIETGSWADSSILIQTLEQNEQFLVVGNRFFVESCQEQYRDFFRLLQDEQNLPLLFHCTAGKDRTGFASAMFLAALGVDRETIVADYLLSGDYLKEKHADFISQFPNAAPVVGTRREYITAAFETIDRLYGGTDKYLTNQLGVDLKKMKSLYTR